MRLFHFLRTAKLATLVAAQSRNLGFTSTPTNLQAGTPVIITYNAQNMSSPITITLRKGDPDNLQTIQVLTSSATNGTFTWIVPDYFANGDDYALEISQGNDNNYSGEFSLSGANLSAVSTVGVATASLLSAQAALSSSFAHSASIASLQGIIASYNSSITNLTAPATGNMSMTAAPVAGSGFSMGNATIMSRNQTMSSATLSGPSSGASVANGGASSTAGGAAAAGGASIASVTSTKASAGSTSSAGAAVGAMNVGSGSTLALVLAAVAVIVL